MKIYTLRLFRDCEQPLRVERLTASTMDVAVGEARRRLAASSFSRSELLDDGRVVGGFQRARRGGDITVLPLFGH